jgi:glycosyltransferase involved in cell wall biosynthesis
MPRLDAPLARVYSPFFPFPPIEGGRWVVVEQIRALAALGWRVELVTWLNTPGAKGNGAAPALPEEMVKRVAVRSLGEVGGSGGEETVVGRAARVLRALGSPHASPEIFHYPPGASDLRERLGPADLGIYHYTFAHAWLTSGAPAPERRVVVHVHNRESEIALARAATASGAFRWLHRRNASVLARHERGLRSLADELWFVSLADQAAFRSTGYAAGLRFVPPTLPDLSSLRQRDTRAGAPEDPVLGFVGTLDFEPNIRGVEWLIRVLAPKLAAQGLRPRLVVAGGGLPDSLRREGERAGRFEFRGYLEDLEPFWGELDGFLVPDLHGIGVRIKLLEAVARGLPTLTHSSAATALAPDVVSHPLLTVSDDPERWAERIETLPDVPAEAEPPPSLRGEVTYRFLARGD